MFRRCFAGFLLVAGLAAPVAAHPHVWVETSAEVRVTAGYVEGLWTTWTFDDVFSQLILADYPADSQGQLSDAASAAVKKGYFDNLKEYRYFTHVQLGTKALPVPVPEQFRASVSPDGRVMYRFFLPLRVRLDAKTPLSVAFYDETFFTDMVFLKSKPLVVTATDGGRVSFVLQPDKSKTFYGGQVTPTFAVIRWSPS